MAGTTAELKEPCCSVIDNIVKYREAILVVLLGLWGMVVLILTPPFQVPDEFAHFDRAFQVSELTMVGTKQGSISGGTLPRITQYDQEKFRFLPFFAEHKLSQREYFKIRKESPAMTPENLRQREFYGFCTSILYPPIPYVFSGLGIALARFFSMTVLSGFYAARLFNLLAAMGFIYCAMRLLRRLPELQLMLFLVAGMPMTIFELMSVSADCMTFSIAVLMISCIVNLALEWKRGIYILLIISSTLLGLCKPYALLSCTSLVLLRSMPGPFFKRVGRIMLVIACAVVPMVVSGSFTQSLYCPVLKKVHIDPMAQMQYLIHNQRTLIPYFLKNIFYENWKNYYNSIYGILGWLDTPLPINYATIYFCLFFGTAFLSPRVDDKQLFPLAARFFFLSVVLALVLFIAVANYLFWNPVGAMSLEGLQGRYFIPLLPVLFIAFYQIISIRLTTSAYLGWALFCIEVWVYFNWKVARILCARYWI